MLWHDAVQPASVSFDRRGESPTTVVTVCGEVDLRVHAQLRSVLVHEVEHGQNLIVDLTQVGFIDSTGLGLLVGVQKRAQERAARLRVEPTAVVLVVTAPEVWRTIEVSRLDRVFTIVDRLEDAECLV